MARTRRPFSGGALAALAAPALLIASETVALAHYTIVQRGRDMASVSEDHRGGSVCDREVDGNAVYGQFFTGLRTVTEWDGGDRGCDDAKLQSHEVVKQVRVCENTRRGNHKDACSPWEFTHSWDANLSSAR